MFVSCPPPPLPSVFSFGSDTCKVVACLVVDGGGWLENEDGDSGEVGGEDAA